MQRLKRYKQVHRDMCSLWVTQLLLSFLRNNQLWRCCQHVKLNMWQLLGIYVMQYDLKIY